MDALPYTTTIRPDTGLTSPKLGIWLFLASEVMLSDRCFPPRRVRTVRRLARPGGRLNVPSLQL